MQWQNTTEIDSPAAQDEHIVHKKIADKARSLARKDYGSCIFCTSELLIGSHILPAGRYDHFKGLRCNVTATCFTHDKMLEYDKNGYMRSPWSRMKLMRRYCRPEHREKMERDLRMLIIVLKEYKFTHNGGLK